MSLDDDLQKLLNESIEPVEPPPGLAEDLIAKAAASGAAAVGGASSGVSGLPLIIGVAIGAGVIIGGAIGFFGGGERQADTTLNLDAVPAYACPGEGEVATLYRGDRVLITGRSGQWLAVRNVRGENERVFIHTDYVNPDTELSGLPEENCDDSGVLTLASGETTTTTTPTDETTTTVVTDETTTTSNGDTTTTTANGATTTTSTSSTSTSTSTTTSPPTTTTSTTMPPDTTAPSISNASAIPGTIWELDGIIGCGANPRQSSVSAFVTDVGSGVFMVTATWTDPLGAQTQVMGVSGSTYSFNFGAYPEGTFPTNAPSYEHIVSITITAEDDAGNESQTAVQVTVTETDECFG